VPDIDRDKEIAELKSRIAVLDRWLAARTHWGAAITAIDEERRGLERRLACLRAMGLSGSSGAAARPST
jgi:hypothetical protein